MSFIDGDSPVRRNWHLLPSSPSLLAHNGVFHGAPWNSDQACSGVMADEELGYSKVVLTVFSVVFLKNLPA